MADVKWIKIVTDIFDDEKMLLIESLPSADSIIVIWFKLLCLAGKNNNNGVFIMSDKIAYTDEMLATIFRRDVNTVRLALKTFEAYGMIEIIDGVITIPNWGKHQTLDKIEKKTAYMKEYMRDYREKQKEKIEYKSNCKTNSKSNVSEADIDKEEDKDIDKDLVNTPPLSPSQGDQEETQKRKRFIPPTAEEVRIYCNERGNSVDPEQFVDFYESKGWYVGKNKMKSWKAAVRTWERERKQKNSTRNMSSDINASRQSQLDYLLNSIKEAEQNE